MVDKPEPAATFKMTALDVLKKQEAELIEFRDQVLKCRIKCAELEVSLAVMNKSPSLPYLNKIENARKAARNTILGLTSNVEMDESSSGKSTSLSK